MTTPNQHLAQKIKLSELSPSQRRVLIATDALALIETKAVTAKTGSYFEPAVTNSWLWDDSGTELPSEERVSPLTAIKDRSCTVCALGACFVASFVHACRKKPSREELEALNREEIMVSLKSVFSSKQLDLMETAFEGGQIGDEINTASDLVMALRFYNSHSGSTNRLKAILTNIIDNCGQFKP